MKDGSSENGLYGVLTERLAFEVSVAIKRGREVAIYPFAHLGYNGITWEMLNLRILILMSAGA